MNPTEPVRRWWLSVDSKVVGPRTETFIVAGLQSGQLSSTTQACPEGGAEWRPLSAWPEWQAHATSGASLPSPPPRGPELSAHTLRQAADAHASLVTNAALPPMANAICIFTIVLLPLYWVFWVLSTIVAPGDTDETIGFSMLSLVIGGPIALAITVLLAIGGLRLRALRASGVRLIRLGLIIDFVFIAVSTLLGLVAIFAVIAASGQAQESTGDGAGMFLNVICGMAGFAALVFEVVAFVWLSKFASSLPLNHRG
ncbi:MAG: DUF4339 domain-containing protein [Planctomycetia bacterium]|nr:DUF4339 domain-containing protein [Planctomycetia bacterium]